MTLEAFDFGTLPDGRSVDGFRLTNAQGMEAVILTYGAILAALRVPDGAGRLMDVVLGYDTLGPYLTDQAYHGAVVGRFANRIARGSFELNGAVYTLPQNNLGNHLHGGPEGFHRALWRADPLPGPAPSVRLTHVSPDGDAGYPGTLIATVTYTVTDDNALRIEFTATTDQPTVVNLSQHAYFNLAGADTILAHQVQILADHFLPVDETLIPLPGRRAVQGTPFDFTALTPVGARLDDPDAQLRLAFNGYDHNWVLTSGGGELALAARVAAPEAGRAMEVWTTQPGVQFYTGNFLDGAVPGKGGWAYPKHAGLCLETQHFPDSPNRVDFPTTALQPGQLYRQTTVYKFLPA